jgi:hypothetical protein
MKTCIKLLLFAAFALSCATSHAATGAELLAECKAVETLATVDRKLDKEELAKFYLKYSGPGLYCMGQLKAASYVNKAYGDRLYGYQLWCLPQGSKVQMLDVVKHVVKYIEERPSSQDKSAANFIVWALQDMFPCPENRSLIELLKKSQRNPGDMAL